MFGKTLKWDSLIQLFMPHFLSVLFLYFVSRINSVWRYFYVTINYILYIVRTNLNESEPIKLKCLQYSVFFSKGICAYCESTCRPESNKVWLIIIRGLVVKWSRVPKYTMECQFFILSVYRFYCLNNQLLFFWTRPTPGATFTIYISTHFVLSTVFKK